MMLLLHGCANLQFTKEGATSNLIAFGKELCVCVPCMSCGDPTFAGLIHLDAFLFAPALKEYLQSTNSEMLMW